MGHGPSIKDDETYEALRDKGASKQKAARISNAQADDTRDPSKKGGEADAYEDWTVDALRARARDLSIEGRSVMNKQQLVESLRNA
jgi:hypothetical protein